MQVLVPSFVYKVRSSQMSIPLSPQFCLRLESSASGPMAYVTFARPDPLRLTRYRSERARDTDYDRGSLVSLTGPQSG